MNVCGKCGCDIVAGDCGCPRPTHQPAPDRPGLQPTSEQLAEVAGTIVGLYLADRSVERISRDVWQVVARQVLEAAAKECTHMAPYTRICGCAERIRALKPPP